MSDERTDVRPAISSDRDALLVLAILDLESGLRKLRQALESGDGEETA